VLEARNITKRYGPVVANDALDLTINPGEILGLLGENGAGKSTLLSILGGMTQPDSGQIYVGGKAMPFGSPREAIQHGISVVYQNFSLVPTFTVREQLRLAGWTTGVLPKPIRGRFSGYERIERLSLGEQQLVEIARALISRPRILLLDEPTSILTSAEARDLFDLVRGLREQGASIVIVTHKLREAMEVCDRIVVLRHGRAVGSVERSLIHWPGRTEANLVGLMFGTTNVNAIATSDAPPPVTAVTGDVPTDHSGHSFLFQLWHVTLEASSEARALRGIDLEIERGEICAIVGVDGQGQRELAAVCAGYAAANGSITLNGERLVTGDADMFRHAGVTLLTDDRHGEGTVPGFSIEKNLILKRQRERPFNRFGYLRRRAARTLARTEIARWHIDPPVSSAPIRTLSGGNVQKVLIARELGIASTLLIANKPTQGLDVRTAGLVRAALRQFARGGGAVLMLSTDIEEALESADRVAVIYDGAVSPLQPIADVSRSELERMMVAGW
jgi:simple sugar transport system ATP-binding protein